MLEQHHPLSAEEISELMQNCEFGSIGSQHYLSIDPPVPGQDYPVDKDKLRQWVALHDDKYRACAQKMAAHIQYIDFAHFYDALIKCAQQLNEEYARAGIKNGEVVIAVPFLAQNKSNAWVTSLLLKHLNFKPLKIVEALETRYIREFLRTNTGVKKILIADDASYSGVDLGLAVEGLNDCVKAASSSAIIDLVIPFVTNKAKERLMNSGRLVSQHIMPTLDELPFTEAEKFLLNSSNVSGCHMSGIMIDRLTPTYFAHKIADSYSTPEKILKFGIILSEPMTNQDFQMMQNGLRKKPANFDRIQLKFIPTIEPCYKQAKPAARLSDLEKKSAPRPK